MRRFSLAIYRDAAAESEKVAPRVAELHLRSGKKRVDGHFRWKTSVSEQRGS